MSSLASSHQLPLLMLVLYWRNCAQPSAKSFSSSRSPDGAHGSESRGQASGLRRVLEFERGF